MKMILEKRLIDYQKNSISLRKNIEEAIQELIEYYETAEFEEEDKEWVEEDFLDLKKLISQYNLYTNLLYERVVKTYDNETGIYSNGGRYEKQDNKR